MPNSEKGIAQYFILILIAAGLILGVVLSQQSQIFRPRADDSAPPTEISGIGNQPQYTANRTVEEENVKPEITLASLDGKTGRLYISGKNFGSTPGKIIVYGKDDTEILSANDISAYAPGMDKDKEVWTPGNIMVDLKVRLGTELFETSTSIAACPIKSGVSESSRTYCSASFKIQKIDKESLSAGDNVTAQSGGQSTLGQSCSPVNGKDACLSAGVGVIDVFSGGVQCKSHDIGPSWYNGYNVPLPGANPGLCVYFDAVYEGDSCQYNVNCWGHYWLGRRCIEGKCRTP